MAMVALFDGPTIFPPVFPAKPDRLDAGTSDQTRPKCPAGHTMSRDTALPGLNERKKISLSKKIGPPAQLGSQRRAIWPGYR